MKLLELDFVSLDAICCWNWLDKKAVRSYWNVPKNANQVWIVLHDRPASDRLMVTFQKNDGCLTSTPGFSCGGGKKAHKSVGCRAIVIARALKIIQETDAAIIVYAECWYEEAT